MAGKKRTVRKSTGKSKSSKSTGTAKRRKQKKPKVVLSGKSVAVLTAVIVGLCLVFLAVNGSFSSSSSNSAEKSKSKTEISRTEKNNTIEKKPQSSVNPEQKKSEEGKTESSSQKNNVSAGQPEKSAYKNLETKKTEASSQKSASDKNTQNAKTDASLIQNGSEHIASVIQPPEPVKPKYEIPQAVNGAKIAFVIDDAGLSVANTKRYTSLPFPITVAVLPKLSHSKDCAYVVRSSGQELILHQPMQSINLNMNPGEGAIKDGMTSYEIASVIKENIEEIGPNVKGFNNHEGSLITADEIKMTAVLEVALEKNIYFLDSRTNVETKAPQAALELDTQIYERDIFIDNTLTKEAMAEQILRGLGVANKKGKAIMIGHVDKSASILPDLLLELYPLIKSKGYKVCFVSQI